MAKCFGSEESGAFVNGILGKIANPDKKVPVKTAAKPQEKVFPDRSPALK
ncbi:MAG: hypothetical protein V8Q57_05510 [Blautia sp.]